MIVIKPISRYRAAAIHLGISGAIAAATLAIMLALWYPPPLFAAMGGMELAILIVGVDVCIGPLITLVIFDAHKKELLFDLTVIATLQLAALCYGIYAMHAGRPVFTVFNGQVFAIVSAADIDPAELAKGRADEFRAPSWTGPRLVAADMPDDPQERSDLTFASLAGIGNQHLPKYYVAYDERRRELIAASRPLDELMQKEDDKATVVREYLQQSGQSKSNLRFLPVLAKRAVLTALIDTHNGDLVRILALNPR